MEEHQEIGSKKSSGYMKVLKFILISALIFVLTLISLVVFLFYSEDEIKKLVIKELNKHLNSEVKVDPENINLTIIKTFPDCSIEFKDVLLLEALKIKKRDTLLFARKLDLLFNVKNIWNKKYNIEKIKLNEGLINLLVLKDGTVNYEFWKEAEVKDTAKLKFKLNSIILQNCKFRYRDKQLHFKSELEIKRLNLKGSFSDSDYELEMIGETNITEVKQGQKVYLKNKTCDFELAFDVRKNRYEIKKARIKINQMALELKGNLTYSDSLENIKLKFNAPGLDISSFLSLLPESFKEKIKDYKSDGHFFAKGSFEYSNQKKYKLLSDFGVSGADVTYVPNDTKINELNVKGHLLWSSTQSELELKNVRLKLIEGELVGDCSIKDFKNPSLKLFAKANLYLENVLKFYPMDTVTKLKGRLQIEAEVEGLWNDLKSNALSKKVKMDLKANMDSLNLMFKGDEKSYDLETCSIFVKDREVMVENCKLLRGSSDVLVNGKLPGLFNYLADRNSPYTLP